MNIVNLLQPPRIVIGDGCAPQCAEYLARITPGHPMLMSSSGGKPQWIQQSEQRRVLLVSSTHVFPILDRIRAAVDEAGLTLVEAPPVDCEPTVTMLEQILQFARQSVVDAVLAVGGGSVIDVAKLTAALVGSNQQIQDVLGINQLECRGLPLICLPTTAGTGAEVSPNAILLDETDELKKGAVSPHLVPDAAFIDPLLTVSVPPAVTAATGLDALTHCIEAYANKFAHPAVNGYALQGIRLIAGHLKRAVVNGKDLEARAALALGSFYGGLCLGPVNTAAVHALAYPLGGRFHVAHGVSNAVLLPHVIQFNLPAAPDRYADIAVALGVTEVGPPERTAERGVGVLVNLSRNCGVPQRLSELGIPREAIPSMAKAAMQVTRLLKNNLRALTEADANQIYEASY